MFLIRNKIDIFLYQLLTIDFRKSNFIKYLLKEIKQYNCAKDLELKFTENGQIS